MDIFKRALEYIQRMWANLSTSQRTGLAVAATVMALVLVWGSTSGVGESMVRVVGHEIPDAERGDVLKKLQEKNVKYEVRNLDIYVPREEAERVVLELAGDGVMSDRAVWSFLESSDIIASEWQLKKRYQVALQRQLQAMIRKVDGVRNASVILSPASESQQLGFRDGAKASASVQVELQSSASFGGKQAKAIAGLVARAVPGLDADRVHIMDTQGNAYRIPRDNGNLASTGEIRDLEARLETDIKEKIKDLFRGAIVAVKAQADAIESLIEKKTHEKPQAKVAEERKRVEKSKPAGGVGGIKGESQVGPTEAGAAGKDETESESKEQNIFNEEYRKDIIPAGIIKKVTVAVMIPQEPEDKLQLQDVKSLIAKASGFDDATALTNLSVMFVPSKKPEQAAPVAASERVVEFLSAKGATIAMVVLGFVALIIFFRLLRGAMPRGTVEEIQSLTAQLAEGPEIDVPQPVLTSQDNINRVKQGIQDVISRNPAGAAVGLKQWMGEQNR
jgi:flagellar M-ring protein FliF